MAQTKKQPKRSATMWLDARTKEWLQGQCETREVRSMTEAAERAFDAMRALRTTLAPEDWTRVLMVAGLEKGTPGETVGLALAELVLEALEKRGRK